MSLEERIDDNIDQTSRDILAALVKEHFDAIIDSSGFDCVEMDRALSDLFEFRSCLSPHDVAERIGAIAVKMFAVDLRVVAKQTAVILRWGEQNGILDFVQPIAQWQLKRYEVTYIPTRAGWQDVRVTSPPTRMSRQGLISRELKYRRRRRNAERDFIFRLVNDCMNLLPTTMPLSEPARQLVFPYGTIGALRTITKEAKDELMLWQAVQLHWSLERMVHEELVSPLALVDFNPNL